MAISKWKDPQKLRPGTYTEFIGAPGSSFAARPPTVPGYTQPSLSLAGTASGQLEIGSRLEITLTPAWAQNDAGSPAAYRLTKNGAEIFSGSAPVSWTPDSLILDAEEITIRAAVDYGEGPLKTGSDGEPYPDGRIQAGSVQSNEISYSGVRALFYGADTGAAAMTAPGEIRGLTKLLAPADGMTFTLVALQGSTRVSIAYPAGLGEITSVKYVELSNAEYMDIFDASTVDVGGENNVLPVAYRLYTCLPPMPLGGKMTLNVTIGGD